MNLESKIKEILFEIGKDIKIHKLIDGNLIVEIDYEKYTNELVTLFWQMTENIDSILNFEAIPECRSYIFPLTFDINVGTD